MLHTGRKFCAGVNADHDGGAGAGGGSEGDCCGVRAPEWRVTGRSGDFGRKANCANWRSAGDCGFGVRNEKRAARGKDFRTRESVCDGGETDCVERLCD